MRTAAIVIDNFLSEDKWEYICNEVLSSSYLKTDTFREWKDSLYEKIIEWIQEKAKEIAPELWEAHTNYVDETLLKLYEKGLMQVEYDENLEATLHLSPEGQKIAKEMGLIQMDMPEPPND